MKLRDYQEKAVEAIIESWRQFASCLIVLPTGCGKTVVFGEVIRRLLGGEIDIADIPRRAMVLAHREELIHQARDKVVALTHADTQVEMGEFKVTPMFGAMPRVVVSTVQTQATGRMAKFSPGDFGVLVIDEAHHATAASYRRCAAHYLANPRCRLLGVTATPDRADASALAQVFRHVAFEYTITEAIRDGWLVPIAQRYVKVGTLDFSGVHTTAGDLNAAELAEVLEEEQNLHGVAAPAVEVCGERRAIVFAATVRQAERLAEIIRRRGRTADWVCGKTPREERREKLARFSSGETQFMVNVGVLTEGFDDAGVEMVVMARPTKSRALYAQMAGRATRPAAAVAGRLGELATAEERRALIAASAKPSCTILDFVGNSGRHKLVTSADILGGRDDDPLEEEARRRAKRRCEQADRALDIAEELERSREEIRREKAEAERRRNFVVAKAKYTLFDVNPFNVFQVLPLEDRPGTARASVLSPKQRQILRERMKINPDTISAAQGRQLIDEHFRRINRHLATYGQSKILHRYGLVAPMSFDEASRTINRLLHHAS